jgi:hypothetical protein
MTSTGHDSLVNHSDLTMAFPTNPHGYVSKDSVDFASLKLLLSTCFDHLVSQHCRQRSAMPSCSIVNLPEMNSWLNYAALSHMNLTAGILGLETLFWFEILLELSVMSIGSFMTK